MRKLKFMFIAIQELDQGYAVAVSNSSSLVSEVTKIITMHHLFSPYFKKIHKTSENFNFDGLQNV